MGEEEDFLRTLLPSQRPLLEGHKCHRLGYGGDKLGYFPLPSFWKEQQCSWWSHCTTSLQQGSQVPIVSCGMQWEGGLRTEGWAWLYLIPLLLHPVCRAVLVSTRMDGQGLGSWVTLCVRDHLALQVATGDETAYASLTTRT